MKTALQTLSLARLVTRRFIRSERGVTAIEFAVVGPVFLLMIGATIETALTYFAGEALYSAVTDSSRLLRTGQTDYLESSENYRAALCGRLYGVFDCDGVKIAVRALDDFDDFSTTAPIDEGTGAWTFAEEFSPGEGSSTVMVEAYYKWPTFFNFPSLTAGQTADGKRLLTAAHVYENEPF